jgi:hypothetical protein
MWYFLSWPSSFVPSRDPEYCQYQKYNKEIKLWILLGRFIPFSLSGKKTYWTDSNLRSSNPNLYGSLNGLTSIFPTSGWCFHSFFVNGSVFLNKKKDFTFKNHCYQTLKRKKSKRKDYLIRDVWKARRLKKKRSLWFGKVKPKGKKYSWGSYGHFNDKNYRTKDDRNDQSKTNSNPQ